MTTIHAKIDRKTLLRNPFHGKMVQKSEETTVAVIMHHGFQLSYRLSGGKFLLYKVFFLGDSFFPCGAKKQLPDKAAVIAYAANIGASYPIFKRDRIVFNHKVDHPYNYIYEDLKFICECGYRVDVMDLVRMPDGAEICPYCMGGVWIIYEKPEDIPDLNTILDENQILHNKKPPTD